jgi:hypothetical protein
MDAPTSWYGVAQPERVAMTATNKVANFIFIGMVMFTRFDHE